MLVRVPTIIVVGNVNNVNNVNNVRNRSERTSVATLYPYAHLEHKSRYTQLEHKCKIGETSKESQTALAGLK